MAYITTTKWGLLALIPFQPLVGLQETFEHLTDIMQAVDGTESRVPMRSVPRVTYSYSFPAKIFDTPGLYNTIYAAIRKKFAVPVWQQASKLKASVSTGDTTIKIEKTVDSFDYTTGGMALLYTSKDVWEWVEVAGTTSADNSVQLSTPITKYWNKAVSYLMPMRVGYVADKVTRNITGISSKYDLAFEIIDNPSVSNYIPTQYLGEDLILDGGLMPSSGALVREIDAEIDSFDAQLGPVFKRTLWKHSRHAYNARFVLETPDEIAAMKKRFQRHQGRYKKFWIPSFDMNLHIKAVSGATIDIHPDSYGQYGQMHKTLAFRLLDGTTEIRKVIAVVAVDAETTRLTLSASVSFTKEQVFYATYLGICRLDSDTLVLNWVGNGKCEAGLRIIEIEPS